MMSAFDYSIQPIALNYSNFGFLTSSVNCIWTWVIVLTTTATVSVLAAIRAAAASPSSPRGRIVDEAAAGGESISKECPNPATEPDTAATMLRNAPRGKFSLYYIEKDNDDDCGDDEINGCDSEWEGDNDDGEVLHWVGATLKMKMEGIGLYDSQDLKRLDGSVVRLWDGCRRRRNPMSPIVTTCVGDVVVTW